MRPGSSLRTREKKPAGSAPRLGDLVLDVVEAQLTLLGLRGDGAVAQVGDRADAVALGEVRADDHDARRGPVGVARTVGE